MLEINFQDITERARVSKNKIEKEKNNPAFDLLIESAQELLITASIDQGRTGLSRERTQHWNEALTAYLQSLYCLRFIESFLTEEEEEKDKLVFTKMIKHLQTRIKFIEDRVASKLEVSKN